MVTHLAIGSTYRSGTVEFNNQKIALIEFDPPFKYHPSVKLTLEDSGATMTPYRTKVKKNQFRIAFKSSYTGTVGWDASGE